MSKHEKIIEYIQSLKPGVKISVRGIASDLKVSEGTAYRAIKECEDIEIVSTIPRVGTVRVEKVEKKNIECLTYAEVVNIVDGAILGGKDGVYKTLSKFFIGAMTVDAALKFIEESSLIIVGNREELQEMALMNNCGVLISGGFDCSERIRKLADIKCLPIISSAYDTFTIASLINKALSESNMKKDIILVEDIMTEAQCLYVSQKVRDFKEIVKSTNHERFPVLEENGKIAGIITIGDIDDSVNNEQALESVMTKNPIILFSKTTVAYAAHIMVKENIKMCPIVEKKKMVGVITRQDVIKALNYASRQKHVKETMEDLILENFKMDCLGDTLHFSGELIPEMLNELGTASSGALNMIICTTAEITVRHKCNANIYVDNVVTYFMRPAQMNRPMDIYTKLIDIGRSSCKVEVNMFNKNKDFMAKSILSAKILSE
ncbi:DRTGG domain-containing protein [Haloimpatiens sp. FM7315]|uniref:DRTGG domain-containing protein n=1 Tax=Haloimpatiens sp. FM7315 TaxID=3298609 RepID=UPI00370C574D